MRPKATLKPQHLMHEMAKRAVEDGATGIMTHHVKGDDYSYTYGRAHQNKPDFLVVGEHQQLATQMIRAAELAEVTEPGVYVFEEADRIDEDVETGRRLKIGATLAVARRGDEVLHSVPAGGDLHHGFCGTLKVAKARPSKQRDLEYLRMVGEGDVLRLTRVTDG